MVILHSAWSKPERFCRVLFSIIGHKGSQFTDLMCFMPDVEVYRSLKKQQLHDGF